jgi:hypothetical protein
MHEFYLYVYEKGHIESKDSMEVNNFIGHPVLL